MTRREFFQAAAAATAVRRVPESRLSIPVHRMTDAAAQYRVDDLRRFWRNIWPEAVRDFSRSGIELHTTDGTGKIGRTPGGRPRFFGLERGAINLVLTDHLPEYWDEGRALAGVTLMGEGYHLCMIALRYAHGHRVPYLSVNTCVHELLHALLQDIFVSRPGWFHADERELRDDWYATRLWLFHDGGAIRKSAQAYLDRLRTSMAGMPAASSE